MKSHLRWAVLGVGRAGRARCEAILEHPDCDLVGVYRGRFAHDIDAPLLTAPADIERAADAVAICSPDAVHPTQVAWALRAGLHVVVEYPLAPTATEAAALFRLAKERNLLLHVEHIELLSATARTLRGHIRPPGVKRLTVAFERPGEATAPGLGLALANLARLHRAVDLGGPLSRLDRVEVGPGQLTAAGQFVTGAKFSAHFSQHPDFSRRTVIEVTHHQDRWRQDNDVIYKGRHAQTVLHGIGKLFAADHSVVMRRLLYGEDPYVSDARILHVLAVADALRERRVGPVPSR